jgi:hypothetical protein
MTCVIIAMICKRACLVVTSALCLALIYTSNQFRSKQCVLLCAVYPYSSIQVSLTL